MTRSTLPLRIYALDYAQGALQRARIAHYYATLEGNTTLKRHWMQSVRFWSIYCKHLRAVDGPRTLQ